MDKMRLPNSIFLLLVLLGALQFAYYAPRLPEIIGSHFGAAGSVNGWQTKLAFFSMELFMIVLAAIISFGVPRLLDSIPISLINLPNKEFWFAPERRQETLAYFRAWSAWFGCALLAFLLFVMELAFRANLHTPPQFNNSAFIPALLAFVFFDITLVLRLILHFSRPSE
jgi:serine/threonine-protein kinase